MASKSSCIAKFCAFASASAFMCMCVYTLHMSIVYTWAQAKLTALRRASSSSAQLLIGTFDLRRQPRAQPGGASLPPSRTESRHLNPRTAADTRTLYLTGDTQTDDSNPGGLSASSSWLFRPARSANRPLDNWVHCCIKLEHGQLLIFKTSAAELKESDTPFAELALEAESRRLPYRRSRVAVTPASRCWPTADPLRCPLTLVESCSQGGHCRR